MQGSAPRVAELEVAEGTVFRIKAALPRRDWLGYCKTGSKRTGTGSFIALACSPAPEGHDHWTLRLLAGKVVELGLASSLSHETVRLHLKKRSQAVAEAGVVHSR